MSLGISIILLLAVIQGLTEFLPVSSSGHLVLAEALLNVRQEGLQESVLLEVAVHIGTLGAVLLVYRSRVRSICSSLVSFFLSGFRRTDRNSEDVSFTGWILVASIPAFAAGILLHDQIVTTFNFPRLTSILLVATGFYLVLSRIRTQQRTLTWVSAALIGCAQAIAMLPGCSRSGWTITTALLCGLGFQKAAEFSFLLSIPAICGALILELYQHPAHLLTGMYAHLIVGAATAFLTGYLALTILLYMFEHRTFHRFAYYLLPVGVASFLWITFAR